MRLNSSARRAALAGLLAVVALLCLAATLDERRAVADPDATAAARARASYAAMQHRLDHTRAHAWPFVRLVAAAQSIAELPDATRRERAEARMRLRQLRRFWRSGAYESLPRPPFGPGGDLYYDDNEWIGLELMRRYAVTRQRGLLERSRAILRLVIRGWDRRAPTCPGGVKWTPVPRIYQRGTVTNGPGAQLAVAIYEATGDRRALGWGQRMYAWAERCMLDEQAGLYQDHFRADGSRDTTIWSYNQGSMIGAAIALYRATGDRAYLDTAAARAARALDYFEDSRLPSEPPYFLAIYFRNLLAYEQLAGGTSFRTQLERYADQAWNQSRDPHTGIFGSERPEKRLLTQAGMVEIYALVAGS
ncbi:MAG TPA: glycoside hydrolase family 76 protein [Thermoleophilaceae bacterium]